MGRWSRNASDDSSSNTTGAATRPATIRSNKQLAGSATAQDSVRELAGGVDQKIRRPRGECVRLKAPGDPARRYASIARRLHVHRTVAHHEGFLPRGADFAHQCFDAHRMRLLLLETVASVNAAEVRAEPETIDDSLAEAHGLVGEDGHGKARAPEFIQHLPHPGV